MGMDDRKDRAMRAMQTTGPLAGHIIDGLGHTKPAQECRCREVRREELRKITRATRTYATGEFMQVEVSVNGKLFGVVKKQSSRWGYRLQSDMQFRHIAALTCGEATRALIEKAREQA